MGKDNQPKARQLRRRLALEGQRERYARILIVTEGSRTEPLYLEEIRAAHRLHSANVAVQPGRLGTAPMQVVEYAKHLFEKGDPQLGIRPRQFDQVYAVFDRDDHASYFDALGLVRALDGCLPNDEKIKVRFSAVASVPCFELWLLLHFQDVLAPMQRSEVTDCLRLHMPYYAKGQQGVFAHTQARLGVATRRAQELANRFNAHTAPEPYTGWHGLVQQLINLRT